VPIEEFKVAGTVVIELSLLSTAPSLPAGQGDLLIVLMPWVWNALVHVVLADGHLH